MTRIFRSKPFALHLSVLPPPPLLSSSPPSLSSLYDDVDSDENEDEQGYLADFNSVDGDSDCRAAATTPFIGQATKARAPTKAHHPQFSLLAVLAVALRKSLVTCSVEADDVASDGDIGWPTDVRHVSHVTFDRFNGFLGLPVELEPDVPRKPPSASTNVFGVSPQSMQCTYDHRGNSVPTILLRMQNRLYSEGGLQAEGIFRINPENSQEEDVRNQLNKGVVPHGIDVHCLSGLIKAWFRELPYGVLDALTPEQVMHCNTEDECTQLVKLLPPTEAALFDWAINLMADVVQHEDQNKMNERNIAMVFAPNMTQMADPLTALIHAVQVMNFLKTLILKTLREREELAVTTLVRDHTNSAENTCEPRASNETQEVLHRQALDDSSCNVAGTCANCLPLSAPIDRLEYENNESSSFIFQSKNDNRETYGWISDRISSSPVLRKRRTLAHSFKDGEYDNTGHRRILDRLSLRKGMWKLRRHPLFQLSKAVGKSGGMEV